MATALDVAQYILDRRGPMTAMKLQKLVYYSQAWSTVWDDNVLFEEQIEAWDNGPVVRELWKVHQGQFKVERIAGGNSGALTQDQKETIDTVLEFYGDKSAQWLSDLTHMENPWKDARASDRIITPEALSIYYSSLEAP